MQARTAAESREAKLNGTHGQSGAHLANSTDDALKSRANNIGGEARYSFPALTAEQATCFVYTVHIRTQTSQLFTFTSGTRKFAVAPAETIWSGYAREENWKQFLCNLARA